MAQVYIPDSVREREQLQGGVNAPEVSPPPHEYKGEEVTLRRFDGIDVLIALVLLAVITLIVIAASRWTAPSNPPVHIDLAPSVLPAYAGYSLLRMVLAYLLALIFTLVYGHIAAKNRRAAVVMVPLLDILQSVPILSFLPAVVLALVATFPNSYIGLELASVLLIFTSQAWNMTFSFYHTARTLPNDLKEFSAVARLRPWQRFLKLEVPSSMIGLIWNSMMSWAGGWFFLMASEQFTLGNSSFQLPGLGSYLQLAASTGNTGALLLGLFTLITLIILLDFCLWRPLAAWADKFKLEMNSQADPPTSPILNIIRSSALIYTLNRRVFRPIGDLIARLLNRLQPLPGEYVTAEKRKGATGVGRPQGSSRWQASNLIHTGISARQVLLGLLGLGALAVVTFGIWNMVVLLAKVNIGTWGLLLLAAGATWLRTMAALAIGVAWTVPLGVAIGMSPRWSKRLQPVVQVVASIPATGFFPILLPILVALPGGLSLAAIILMVLGIQWYILFNVIAGAMAIPNDLKETTTIYHVKKWRRWKTLILPAIFPYLVTGLLTASGGAWNASIVTEYVQFGQEPTSTFGLGAEIAKAAKAANFPVLLAGTLLLVAVVILINRVLWKRMYGLAERRYTLG